MWGVIFGTAFLVCAVGLIYLLSPFRQFTVLRKLSGERRGLSWLYSFLVLAVICAAVALWLGLVNMLIVILHLAVIWLFCDLAGAVVKRVSGNHRPKFYCAGAAALLLTAVYLGVGWYLAHHVWQVNYTIETAKEVGRLRVLQFADSHVGTTFHAGEFSDYVDEMQEQNPDLVVITGDFVDDNTTKEDMIACCAALSKFDTTYGVYYVYGNHDKSYFGAAYRGYSGEDLAAELEKNGVTVLEDEAVLLDNRFYLVGRQDYSEIQRGSSRADMETLLQGLDRDKFILVLDHQPNDYEAQAAAGADLVLSGHTHGGQLLPLQLMMGMNDQVYGLEKREETSFIVTSGISDWAIKFKTGCKSEYVVIDIQ